MKPSVTPGTRDETRPSRGRRRAWAAVIIACLTGCLAALSAQGLGQHLTQGGWTPASADSVRADGVLTEHFHAGSPDLVLLATTSGSVDAPEAQAAGRSVTARLAADPRTAWVRSYWQTPIDRQPTSDRSTADLGSQLRDTARHRATVLVRFRGNEQDVRSAAAAAMKHHTGRFGPLTISASGEAAVRAETERLGADGLRLAEFIAAPAVLLLLLWVFGSLVAALLPVLVGLLAVATTTAFLRVLTEHATVSVFALNVTTLLGFGLAVDYSLLLVSRFREELSQGAETSQAVRRTRRTAGRAVACSAAIIAVSLGALLLFPLPLLRSFAYGGVAVAVAAATGALLVLPALFLLLGERINSRDVFARLRRAPADPQSSTGLWYRLAHWVTRRPLAVTAGTLLVLLALAAPVTHIRFGAYDDRILPTDSPVAGTSRELRAHFDSEAVNAAVLVLPGFRAERSPAALDSYARRLAQEPGVRQVTTATGTYAHGRHVAATASTPRTPLPEKRGGAQDRPASKALMWPQAAAYTGPPGTWLSVATTIESPYSPEGYRLTNRLRAVPAPTHALVGGPGARLADTRRMLTERLPLAVALMSGATFLLLLVFTRSLLIPIKAILLNILSLAATFGVLVTVFQQGHLTWLLGNVTTTGVTDIIVPALMFCIAFGLSMDYEVFLLSRIVEEHRKGASTTTAVAVGLQRTGRLFTSAALVFAAVMACLALSSLALLKLLGVGLALAVIIDGTLVRALLVPAVMRLAGGVNWWLPGSKGRPGPDAPSEAPTAPDEQRLPAPSPRPKP
ncbi:MMPL family transporter [Streptomyces hundungensis]|uniref:MMPL family transporter n=1 Tax=Streptomyces hundungensis TaxID=1077946 RepID=UPI0033E597DE